MPNNMVFAPFTISNTADLDTDLALIDVGGADAAPATAIHSPSRKA